MKKPTKLSIQLAIYITIFIFLIETVVLYFSFHSEKQMLLSLHEVLDADVMAKTGKHFLDLHPTILSDADIKMRLNDFIWNVTGLVLIISIVVSLGTLGVFNIIAGRHLTKMIRSNKKYKNIKLDENAIISEDNLPNNEISDLITSYNKMIKSIISYRDDIESQLNEAKENLVQSAKLSTIGELTATLLHDINNPLTMISGNISLIKGQYPELLEDEKLAKKFTSLETATNRIIKMTQRMGRFSRVKTNTKEETSLNTIVDHSIEFITHKLNKNKITVNNNIPNDTEIIGDAISLEQVFTNLISNASDAMEKTQTKDLTLDYQRENGHHLILVKDTGTGIEKEKIEQVFSSFFTTKEAGKGTGLGLSSAKRILEDHQGDIMITSEVGKGTTFTLKIPAA